ncbi:MAG: hypothetical protein LN408_04650, partial [Candidatus Thermoplasmatota archaeon]|nr:hypothetical protein [Candidatus Thermoplasmatota archaeon]
MRYNKLIKFISFLISFLFILLSTVNGYEIMSLDHDPLVDVEITIDIIQIRSLEKDDVQIPTTERIDIFGSP